MIYGKNIRLRAAEREDLPKSANVIPCFTGVFCFFLFVYFTHNLFVSFKAGIKTAIIIFSVVIRLYEDCLTHILQTVAQFTL